MKLRLVLLLALGCARQTSMPVTTGDTGMTGGTGGSAGGSAATGGGGGVAADAAPCPPECLRAVRCVSSCGSTPISVGCCPCAPPAFDDVTCNRPPTFESFVY